jgi:hypothetical protein
MPSSSAKQHRFMQAVAHSPSFAKKAGVSQSVGKDFSADKSKTFKKGDMMKKRYDTGGEVDFDADDDPESQKVFRDYSGNSGYDLSDDDTGALAENTPTRSTAKAAPAASSRAASAPARAAPAATASRSGVTPAQEAALVRRERETQETEISKREAAEDKGKSAPKLGAFSNTAGRQAKAPSRLTGRGGYEADEMGAVTGRRGDPKYKRVVTDEQKAKNAENFGTVATALIPGGTAIKGAQLAYKGLSAAEKLRKLDKANVPMREIIEARRLAGYAGRKKGGAIMESKSMKFAMGGDMPSSGGARPDPRMMAAMRAKQAARQQPMRRPPPGGMPPPAQPPMGMKKGGVAKFAKGGGIESRGKTKGTVIRMAAGGSVSARADGIAQRGKTKFKNY